MLLLSVQALWDTQPLKMMAYVGGISNIYSKIGSPAKKVIYDAVVVFAGVLVTILICYYPVKQKRH
jgi:hypothetical protein